MGGVTLNNRSQCLHTFGSGAGATVIIVPAASAGILAGQRVGLFRIITTVLTAVGLTLQDSGGNPLSGLIQLAANGSIVLDMPDNGDPWWQSTTTNPGLQWAQTGGPTTVGFDVWWLGQV
jgi:hypothetical protein